MNRFYLGQRVRIISSHERYSWLVGIEGLVNELDCIDEFGNGGCIGVTVHDDPDWCFHSYELEPLTRPHEACDDAEFIASLDRLAAKVGEMA